MERDNNYCHYVIPRKPASQLCYYYHPAGGGVIMVVYRLLGGWLVSFFRSWLVVRLGGWAGAAGGRKQGSVVSIRIIALLLGIAYDEWLDGLGYLYYCAIIFVQVIIWSPTTTANVCMMELLVDTSHLIKAEKQRH
jgi:hypothetical protein